MLCLQGSELGDETYLKTILNDLTDPQPPMRNLHVQVFITVQHSVIAVQDLVVLLSKVQ